MLVKYLGHSSFYIKGKYSVVIDPFGDIGYEIERQSVDLCLSTHNHYDHNAFNTMDYKIKIDALADVCLAKDINLTPIKSFHDKFLGKKRGENIMYKFEIDGVKFCHMGDFGEEVDQCIATRIGQTDVLFIPIGGKYTINYEEALQVIEFVKPKIAIPMHYQTSKSNVGISGIEQFLNCNLNPTKNVGYSFELEKENLPNTTTVVLPLQDKF